MKVLICGDRNWADELAIRRELQQFPTGTVIIHGDCRGADRIAGQVAKELLFVVEVFPAEWSKYGKAAGPLRNTKMLSFADQVIAFHSNLQSSRGTRDTVMKAKALGISVKVISRKEEF